jgi:hypothetical protein
MERRTDGFHQLLVRLPRLSRNRPDSRGGTMIQLNPSALPKAQASQGELEILDRFDYAPLDAEIAQQVQKATERIRQLVKRTLEDLLAVGTELLTVKQSLPHGSFGPWLRAEFGWKERTARNFMAVAQRFGGKTAIIADLPIEPTAAYLLAAPSVPEEASAAAIQRAESGVHITVAVAKEILRTVQKKSEGRRKAPSAALPDGKLLGQLLESLESFRRRWDRQQLSVLARQLREFADSLEEV